MAGQVTQTVNCLRGLVDGHRSYTSFRPAADFRLKQMSWAIKNTGMPFESVLILIAVILKKKETII